MKLERIENYTGGWFIGNFKPSIIGGVNFEVAIKSFVKGDTEAAHFQLVATEVTVVVSGTCRIGDQEVVAGDVVLIEPGEIADFEALEDVVLVACKTPSLPDDKMIA